MRTHCLLTPLLLLFNLGFLGRDTGTSGAALGGTGVCAGGLGLCWGAGSVLAGDGGRSVPGGWVCVGALLKWWEQKDLDVGTQSSV